MTLAMHDPLYVAEYVRLNWKTKTLMQMAHDSGIPQAVIERRMRETGRKPRTARQIQREARLKGNEHILRTCTIHEAARRLNMNRSTIRDLRVEMGVSQPILKKTPGIKKYAETPERVAYIVAHHKDKTITELCRILRCGHHFVREVMQKRGLTCKRNPPPMTTQEAYDRRFQAHHLETGARNVDKMSRRLRLALDSCVAAWNASSDVKITREQVMSGRRVGPALYVRQLLCLMARDVYGMTYHGMNREGIMGNHTSCMHSCSIAKDTIETNKDFAAIDKVARMTLARVR